MVAQQDGHDFALGHLPFAVSHSLVSLVYGGDMDRSKNGLQSSFFPSTINFKMFKPVKINMATFLLS